jgi:hypothetical protein
MNGATRQEAAYRRAISLSTGLARDLEGLAEGTGHPTEPIGISLARVERALAFALGFDVGDDPEAVHRRAHARNVAMVLRRMVDTWPGGGAESAELARAARYSGELVETVVWIRVHAPVATARPAAPWHGTWAGRLVALPACLLPAEIRLEFIEDQCGNLAAVGSRREWLVYVIGLFVLPLRRRQV